jgi:hypothetical protein
MERGRMTGQVEWAGLNRLWRYPGGGRTFTIEIIVVPITVGKRN